MSVPPQTTTLPFPTFGSSHEYPIIGLAQCPNVLPPNPLSAIPHREHLSQSVRLWRNSPLCHGDGCPLAVELVISCNSVGRGRGQGTFLWWSYSPNLPMCLGAPLFVGRWAFNLISQQRHTKSIPDKWNHLEQLSKEAGRTDAVPEYLLH